MPRTLYDVLQSHPGASEAELCAAWQRLADPLEREGGIAGSAATHLNEINAAWAVLGNPASRAAYDSSLPAEAFAAPSPITGASRPLLDWRIGRLLILITCLSMIALVWSSCRTQAFMSASEGQSRAIKAQQRAMEAEMRAQMGPAGASGANRAEADARAEMQRRDEAQALEFEEARRQSDLNMAAREAARERREQEEAEQRRQWREESGTSVDED
ncbi:J domain-containing protein [Niveibacterium sp. 24ML]|uniref:hypothetical protein n=1 Tax=Niveibacterium sp. 24ML TaxID=2985512 RepID=UPI0022714953|nr:hypothetical protein [Niveibacterium sp. 24ML]MCX9155819.1 J domain-containing protein [Niveibacterium sp. 24ML]